MLACALQFFTQQGGNIASPGRKQASGFNKKIAASLKRPYSTGSGSSNSDNNNDDDTPPQIKQATKPLSHNRGFFCLSQTDCALNCRLVTLGAQLARAAADMGRARRPLQRHASLSAAEESLASDAEG